MMCSIWSSHLPLFAPRFTLNSENETGVLQLYRELKVFARDLKSLRFFQDERDQ